MKRIRVLLLLALLVSGTPSAEADTAVTAAPSITAIVAQDQTALRAAARDSAAQHAVLWAGDTVEVRGRRLDFLQVYDHRRERAGFVRASQLRPLALSPEDAPELLAVVRFLRDSTGSEALGIGYAAAYLKAAPAEAIGAEAFDALGTMAERLARRASSNRHRALDAALAAQVEVAVHHGIGIRSFEHEGRMQLCYDGDAFRRVLALDADPEQKARAALALTRHECVDPDLMPLDRYAYDVWRAEVLDRAPRDNLPPHLTNRLRLRSAAVWSSVVFGNVRSGLPVKDAADRALQELAGVDAQTLAEEDAAAFSDAAVRVGASRWAAEPVPPAPKAPSLSVITASGKPGETCIKLIDAKHDASAPLVQRCTYATVWTASARVNAQGTALALAVQPLDGWRELWVFQKVDEDWRIDVVPPAADTPALGYVEFAGWVPGTRKLLAAREAKVGGRFTRTFEVLSLDSLRVEKQAEDPAHLSTFYRWQDATWKQQTVSLRH